MKSLRGIWFVSVRISMANGRRYRQLHTPNLAQKILLTAFSCRRLAARDIGILDLNYGGQWPSESEILDNYQQPLTEEDTSSKEEGGITHRDTIFSLKVSWIQKDLEKTMISNKSLLVSREITNNGNIPREYLYRNDFYTPQED
jgi:hypothetical protein